jgi:membrane-associated phospholipid phosphatase
MTKPDPQPPPGQSLRRLSGTRLLGGTTGAARAADTPGAAGGDGESGPAAAVIPLLPGWARRPAAITIACCAVVVAVLGALAANRSRGSAVDRPVDSWLRQNLASHHHAVLDVAYLGGGQAGIVLAAALIVACLLARRVNGAILTLVSFLVSVGLTEHVLKPLVHETIGKSLTYPSGHTVSVFTLTAVVGVLMLNPPRQRPRLLVRVLLVAGLGVVSCAVAVATIVLSFHYFTDTIAGAALAVGVALACTLLLDGSAVRRWLGAASPSWLKQPAARPPA